MTSDETLGAVRPSGGAAAAGEVHGRTLAGPVLQFDLRAELEELRRQQGYGSGKPAGKTLVKEPDLRIVIMALSAGAVFEKHRASGPVSIQSIEGSMRVRLPDRAIELSAGGLLALQANVPHDVEAMDDAALILTIGRTTYDQVSDRHETKA